MKTLDKYAKVFLVSSEDLAQGLLKEPVYKQLSSL